jgi:hypothetical protein
VLPRSDPQGVVFLSGGLDPDDALPVEPRLLVVRLPVHAVGAVATPAFKDNQLAEADRR